MNCSLLVTGKWIEYDDDNPIPQREEDITKLSGGGKIAHKIHSNCAQNFLFSLAIASSCAYILLMGYKHQSFLHILVIGICCHDK